jgi:carbonic anhydrase
VKRLIKGIHHFRAADFRSSHYLFETPGSARRKGALLIVCSDLEIDPHLPISTNLADLYVLQHLCNVVEPHDELSSSGSNSVEQALSLYRPTDIVICGHVPCDVLTQLDDLDDEEMPYAAVLLRHVREAQKIVEHMYADIEDNVERLDILARENVLVQLRNLRTIPAVALRLERGELHLHGWLYRDGVIYAYEVQEEQFVSLEQ